MKVTHGGDVHLSHVLVELFSEVTSGTTVQFLLSQCRSYCTVLDDGSDGQKDRLTTERVIRLAVLWNCSPQVKQIIPISGVRFDFLLPGRSILSTLL